jgi:secondary thiamine-phosphate synthase enzyme
MKKYVIYKNTSKMFTPITGDIEDFLHESGITNGTITVYSPHTTCAIKIMENESRLLRDQERFMERIVPRSEYYFHDDIEHRPVPDNERINAYSHLRSFLASTSETLPIFDGKLPLGRWQEVMLVEFDIGRDRKVFVFIEESGDGRATQE